MYHMIYAMPLYLTALLAVSAALMWRDIGKCVMRNHPCGWRIFCGGMLAVWVFLVLHITHFSRGESALTPQWIPLHQIYTVLTGGNREILRSAWMNMLLFVPGGIGLHDVLPKKRILYAVIPAALFSTGIEIGQWLLRHGQAETDDILTNTAGAAMGWLLMKLISRETYDKNL